jgi:hypothetical protein
MLQPQSWPLGCPTSSEIGRGGDSRASFILSINMAALMARAETGLRGAIEELQNLLPKDARACIGQISFPEFGAANSTQENAAKLEHAIEKLIDVRKEKKLQRQGGERVKEYLRKWYRATYPFATIFLAVTKEASAVAPPKSFAADGFRFHYSIPMACSAVDFW